MSSTNRGGKRSEADFYETPAWCVEWLLRAWDDPVWNDPNESGHEERIPQILEPCAGRGAIIGACEAEGLRAEWTSNDMDAERSEALLASGLVPSHRVFCSDFLAAGANFGGPFDCIITNPPYSLAEEFLRKSLSVAPVVAFLLRLNFLGSQKRAAFLAANPPDVYVLSRRPSFTGGKTDSTEYAWFVWDTREQRSSGKIMVLSGATAR